MKQSILIFLLGIFVTISIASTTAISTSLITIKPITPKSTIVLFGYLSDLQKPVGIYINKGYIIKLIGNDGNTSRGMVVLEKY